MPPAPATEKYAYLPAQVYVLNVNGDVAAWTFTDPQMNLPGVSVRDFALVPISGWNVQNVPALARPNAKP